MKEIEVIILEVDKDTLVEKLLSLGAEKVFEGEVEPIYYDFDDGRLKTQKKILRLRRRGDIFELTLKRKTGKHVAKIREEFEIKVSNLKVAEILLAELGLVEVKRFKKYRESYKLGRVVYEFETFIGLPTSVEIEATSLKDLEKAVELLGYSMDDAKPWSWREMFEHYQKNAS